MLYNKAIFKHIKYETKKASYNLALERGPCPDAQEAGLMERFANKTAIAPTASISVLAGKFLRASSLLRLMFFLGEQLLETKVI